MLKKEETVSLAELAQISNAMPLGESICKVLNFEEIQVYGELTERHLLSEAEMSFDTRVMALALLKTLSHLSGTKDRLFTQFHALPLAKHRDIYYSVPFLAELSGQKNLLEWYQKEARSLLDAKPKKGDYEPLRLLILFYEAALFQYTTSSKTQSKNYLAIADRIFKKIVASFQDLHTAFEKQDKNHAWFHPDPTYVQSYKNVALLWKNAVDVTTVRHGPHLPVQYRRPPQKLPTDWNNLLQIKAVKKVSMINVLYPLACLSSMCREIRGYSSYLLHLVYEQRPGFLEGLQATRVEKHLLNRLRVAYKLKESYPKFPQEMPDKFQREMFLVLIEQALNSLAKKHHLDQKGVEDLTARFSQFNEQVQTQDEIVIELPHPEDEDIFGSTAPAEVPAPAAEANKPRLVIEGDFPAITDDMEFGMGIASMPYVFPFVYEEQQTEIPLEHLPNIKWEEIYWSDIRTESSDTHVFTGVSQLFIKKLETVVLYRYEIGSPEKVKSLKPIKNFLCFVAKEEYEGQTKYYVAKKGNKSGKPTVWVEIILSPRYLEKIEKAFFFILPEPYNQHLLAIPR